MKFPLLATVIIFVVWLTYELAKHNNLNKKAETDYWKKEHASNNVRKKSLDDLKYIKVPVDQLPLTLLPDNQTVLDCIDQILTLSELKIVNLSGITNTDLKLTYGTANLTVLSEYDMNFTLLVRNLNIWGTELYNAGYIKETEFIFEYAISIGSDISNTYRILASIYVANNRADKIAILEASAMALNTIMQKPILNTLLEISQTSR